MSNFKEIKPIGQGGFGNVDLVEDLQGARYARKTFARNQPLDPTMLENVRRRFAKEVRIQGGISHPNTVSVLGSDLNAEPPFYLMPVAESSLAEDLDQDQTLGGNFIAAISDIVAGLEEIHSMQIYHRDLKPANVLRFDNKDKGGRPSYAIGDFGLISLRESRLSLLTNTAMRKSSDYYTAPEVSKSMRFASSQSDIYSLGCILHDMIGIQDRVPCGEIRESGEFSAILLGCTRTDPTQRFKTVRAVLDAILSVDFTPKAPPSQESIDFIAILEADIAPDAQFWDRLADFLEHSAGPADIAAVGGKLATERIQALCNGDTESANRIAVIVARWIGGSAFNFDYCDALRIGWRNFLPIRISRRKLNALWPC